MYKKKLHCYEDVMFIWRGSYLRLKNCEILGLVQTSNFTCAESNANEKNLLFSLICIRFGTCKVRRLNRALVDIVSRRWRKLFGVLVIAQNAYCSRDIYFKFKNVVDLSYRTSLCIDAWKELRSLVAMNTQRRSLGSLSNDVDDGNENATKQWD